MASVQLRASQGSDECNFGGRRFRVDDDGTVWVPEEGIAPLLLVGGYSLVDPPGPPEPSGDARVRHRSDPAAACSFRGVVYTPDAGGVLTVPVIAVPELTSHGFDLEPRRKLPPVGKRGG
jgi:hypothetical protein